MRIYYALFVALGGAAGAVLRWAVTRWGTRALGDAFPFGTLAANLAGCFLIGLLWTISEHASFSAQARALLFTGVLGAFTTFSTYALESLTLLREGQAARALAYVLASNAAGLAMVYLGLVAARGALWLTRGAAT